MPGPEQTYLKYLTDAVNNPDAYKDYIFGAAGTDWDGDGDPEWDCSGLRMAALKAAGYHVDGRPTAEVFRQQGHKIATPSQVGDYGVLLRSNGTAHHIVMWMPGNKTAEAMGSAYGLRWGTVASLNARGAVWYRNDDVNAFLTMKEPTVPDTSWDLFIAHTGNNSGMTVFNDAATKLGKAHTNVQVPQWAYTPGMMEQFKAAILKVVADNAKTQGK